MEHKEVFARNLKHYMSANGKSRKEVCEALGYSYFTFSDWVNGKKMPRMDKVEQLAKYFGIAKSDLIEETKKAAPEIGNGMSENRAKLLSQIAEMSEEEVGRFLQVMDLILGRK